MSKVNNFGERIKQLREKKGLLQREIANQLSIDTPMLSKIERGERHAKKEQVIILSKVFNAPEKELLSLWLGDKVYDIVKDEEVAFQALKVAEDSVEYHKQKSNVKRK